MRKNKSDFFVPGGKKFLNGDKPDQETFEDLTDSTTFPTELSDRAKLSESGLSKTTIDTKVNTGTDTDQSGISPLGFPTFVKPSQLWRLITSDSQVTLTPVVRNPTAPADSEDGSLIEDIEISITPIIPPPPVGGADNGLSVVTSNIELGGTLTKDTTVNGAGYDFTLDGLDIIRFDNNNTVEIIGGNASLTGNSTILLSTQPTTGTFLLKTPLIGSASAGYVLTLLNATTGECEWQAVPGGNTNVYLSDGTLTGNRQLDGNGFNFTYANVSAFTIQTTTDVLLNAISTAALSAASVSVSATSSLLLATPGVNGSGPAPILGQVLTLTNAATGQCEWQSLPASTDTNIYDNDGTLAANRLLQGATTFSLTFRDLTSFDILQTTSIDLKANTATFGTSLPSTGETRIVTPNQASSSNGDVLTLVNNATGESEWSSAKYTEDIFAAQWNVGVPPATGVSGSFPINAVTHGKGVNPIVQVYKDTTSSGLFNPKNLLYPFASGDLELVEVDTSGNIQIVTADTTINVRVIIM